MIDPAATGLVWQARVETMHRDLRELKRACRAEGTPRIQTAIDNAVRWFGAVTPETKG